MDTPSSSLSLHDASFARAHDGPGNATAATTTAAAVVSSSSNVARDAVVADLDEATSAKLLAKVLVREPSDDAAAAADAAIAENLRNYKFVYDQIALAEYKSFDSIYGYGVPQLVNFFRNFDPVNHVEFDPVTHKIRDAQQLWPFQHLYRSLMHYGGDTTDSRKNPSHTHFVRFMDAQYERTFNYRASLSDFHHVVDYFEADEFEPQQILRSTRYDHVCYAIVSYILIWTDESMATFCEFYPVYGPLVRLIRDQRRSHYGSLVFVREGILYLRNAVQICKKYFELGVQPAAPSTRKRPHSDAHDPDGDNGVDSEHFDALAASNGAEAAKHMRSSLPQESTAMRSSPPPPPRSEPWTIGPKPESQPFQLVSHIAPQFIQHLRRVYAALVANTLHRDEALLAQICDPANVDANIPLNIPAELLGLLPLPRPPNAPTNRQQQSSNALRRVLRTSNFKFVSGQACCGKTSVLSTLQRNGWQIYSRGDCGSFSGKSNNPATIGTMHAALEYVLSLPHTIGDRGDIDNIIWSFIMPACNPIYLHDSNACAGGACRPQPHDVCGDFVADMLNFMAANFNAPSIMKFAAERGVIFLDANPRLNLERLRNRCMDGDPHRSRIVMYSIAQFMMYYTVARLFGWRICLVPYNADGATLNAAHYKVIGRELLEFFGGGARVPEGHSATPVRFAKPNSDAYTYDNLYPQSVGIFK